MFRGRVTERGFAHFFRREHVQYYLSRGRGERGEGGVTPSMRKLNLLG